MPAFSHEEAAFFVANGFVIKRNFVPSQLVDQASALIDNWYGTQMDAEDVAAYTQRSFAPELGSSPELLALFHDSGVADAARSFIGEIAPITTTQIQIRIPESDLTGAQPEKAMHVDGVSCPHLDPAELRTFSMIAGVVLSDVSDPRGGALKFVRGGHHTMADWFRTQWKLGMTDQVPPHIDMAEGEAFIAQPGDVLFMHHLVPHAVGLNHTQTPRKMAYFRVSHKEHENRRLQALRDPWLDYPALTAALR
ncbi:MAG TPA: phytanoyl-CoA dioxygenase family protein [Mycobacteriales bacterium]|nr:phytanoyl-CoA dioxygenase family protein [Mycobacteriales bacterium]